MAAHYTHFVHSQKALLTVCRVVHSGHNAPLCQHLQQGKTVSQALIAALQDPALYPHPVEGFTVIETHISWVLLTGPYAYKIKKPVNFGLHQPGSPRALLR